MIIEARDDVVRLEGALDKNLWPTIQAAANLLLRQHVQGIIIDASGLVRCSTEGARTFLDAMDYIERYHARIVVAAVPPEVMETVRTVPGVRSRLAVSETIDDARKSLSLEGSRRIQLQSKRRQWQDVLVPLIGGVAPEAATALACRLAKSDGQKPRIHLVYVLEVPRLLTLTAPLPEEEAVAARVIEGAEAIVRREGLTPVTYVTRARDAGDEIVHQARQIGANIVVLTYVPEDEAGDDVRGRVVAALLSNAPCEVILNKLPLAAA
jgi:anti-anti-sigma regulatory factor/nucleotide-binding universal stress UspA family protein